MLQGLPTGVPINVQFFSAYRQNENKHYCFTTKQEFKSLFSTFLPKKFLRTITYFSSSTSDTRNAGWEPPC
jgi:hypothetical protein